MNPTLLHALIYAGFALFTLGVVSTGSIFRDFKEDDLVPGVLFAVIMSAFWPFFWLFCLVKTNRKPL